MGGQFKMREISKALAFRDFAVCEKVRAIKRAEICDHPRKNVDVRVIEDDHAFNFAFALDVVQRIKDAADAGSGKLALILPAPDPVYRYAAAMINKLRIPCGHVHTFNMDEYADQDGVAAPRGHKGGFQYWMWQDFFGRIDPKLRMPESQIHFPGHGNVNDYSRMLADLGGADVCYGGIGWCGHIAFVEPHVGAEVGNDLDAYLQLGTRLVELSPVTICQNSLYADAGGAGDWSRLPWKAYTIGPKDIAGAALRSSWNGYGCGDSMWERFICRLAMFGPVTPLVPASILQLFRTEFVLSGAVAADCAENTCERKVEIEF